MYFLKQTLTLIVANALPDLMVRVRKLFGYYIPQDIRYQYKFGIVRDLLHMKEELHP
jgi:hypothetical protein